VVAVELWIIFWGTSVKLVLTKKTYIIIGIDDWEKLISASGKNYYLVRISFGALFIYASLDKLAFPQQFIEIVSNYQILPEFASKIVGFILPLGELILGTLLLVGLYVEVASGGLVVLTIFFTIALIFKAISGNLSDCGCFSLTSNSETNIISLIIRDIFLVLIGSSIFIYSKKNKNLS